MHKSRRVKITDLNPHITCVLCSGYLIEATTIIECLHSFCRTCIVKYLEHNKYCPICEVQVHKTKPLLNIRSDQTLQDIVYKLVPGLFQNEMCRRKDFYLKHPDQKPPDLEGRGEITQFSHIYTADESISLSLEYYNNNVSNEIDNNDTDTKKQEHGSRRYLRCPAAVSVAHLQKLIRAKYGLSNEHRVDILYKNDRLSEDFTLMDIAYIYLWRRKGPLDLTYRIFEVAKRIKLNESLGDQGIKTEPAESEDAKVKNEWKEVQLQISENGVMSVTNIGETKTPETLTNFEVKTEVNLVNKKPVPELAPIEPKSEKAANDGAKLKVEKNRIAAQEVELGESETRLGKHKLPDDAFEKSAKIMKSNNTKTSVPVKNVQQLSRNHPLKIHSQSVNKNNIPVMTTMTTMSTMSTMTTTTTTTMSNTKLQMSSTLNVKTVQLKNQNTLRVQSLSKSVKSDVVKPVVAQKEQQQTAPTTVQSIQVVQSTPNTKILPNPTIIATTIATTIEPQHTTTVTISSLAASVTNIAGQNTVRYTQAGHCVDNTRVTKSDDSIQNSSQKTPISSCSIVSTNNCIQSSKVGIVPKKSPVKIGSAMVYKTLRDPPKAWNPQISRQNLPTKSALYPPNNGASTSDSKQRVDAQSKPAKFFKMRNNVPRYLGNPASGVKPMYQVRDGDKSPPDASKKGETKKPETKLNNNNDVKAKTQTPEVEVRPKIEIKKQSIIKIDPKTLRPIVDKPPTPELLNLNTNSNPSTSCADTSVPEIKINQSTVPIFNPLRNQKSQTSPKIDRRSPKTSSYMDGPKSPMERNSPKTTGKIMVNSPTSKKDKLSLNFTPPNPFIPNLASPNLNPNQFLYPNFPSYDPRVMNNLTAYHPFSMYYSQSRLTYPGLASQNLSIPPNLMSTLNLEVNKNLRKNYEMLQQQLSPTVDGKKSATCAKNPRDSDEKTNVVDNSEKTKVVDNVEKVTSKMVDTTKLTGNKQTEPVKQVVANNEETRMKTNEISNQLQKTNKEKELNAISKETPVDDKKKETIKSEVKQIEPVPIKVEKLDKLDKNECSKVELKSTEKKSKENDIVQNENKEKKIIKNENKMETVKTT